MPPLTASKTPSNNLEKGIASILIYYDLLDRPLTALEIFRYLPAEKNHQPSFFELKKALKQNVWLKKISETRQGLYYLKNREKLIGQRETKLKTSQIKWKKLKQSAKILSFIPFLRLVAVSGSLTLNNAKPSSDFDLLIITKTNRLWSARILIMTVLSIIAKRRHQDRTKDKFCLNCYLTENHLKIEKRAKARNLHSAQEYGRIILLLEKKRNLYRQFLEKNFWLKNFLSNYPWPASPDASQGGPNQHTAKIISISPAAEKISDLFEKLLSGGFGDWLEEKLGRWQSRRIKNKIGHEPADQIYYSNQCLMLHPQSKSYALMEKYEKKMRMMTLKFKA